MLHLLFSSTAPDQDPIMFMINPQLSHVSQGQSAPERMTPSLQSSPISQRESQHSTETETETEREGGERAVLWARAGGSTVVELPTEQPQQQQQQQDDQAQWHAIKGGDH